MLSLNKLAISLAVLSLAIPIIPVHAITIVSLTPANDSQNFNITSSVQVTEVGVCALVSSSGTVSTLTARIKQTPPVTGTLTMTAKIYSASGSPGSCAVGSLLAQSTNSFTQSDLTTSYQNKVFSFNAFQLSSGQRVESVLVFSYSSPTSCLPGQDGCLTNVAANQNSDTSQSNDDNLTTGSGPPDGLDEYLCTSGCISYIVEGGSPTVRGSQTSSGVVPGIMIVLGIGIVGASLHAMKGDLDPDEVKAVVLFIAGMGVVFIVLLGSSL